MVNTAFAALKKYLGFLASGCLLGLRYLPLRLLDFLGGVFGTAGISNRW